MHPIQPHSVVAFPSAPSVARVGEESVLLDRKSMFYFGANETGTEIVEMLRRGEALTAADIAERLAAGYAAPRDAVMRDVITFLQELVDAGLVEQRS